MTEVGRPTQLDDELCLKIKALLLDGHNHKSICEILGINYDTWQGWITRNYNGFTDRLTIYRHERMLQKGESNLEVLMDAEDDKIKLQASIHVTETLGKKWYSKKNETDITSAGKPIINIASEIATKNGLNPTTEGNSEERS